MGHAQRLRQKGLTFGPLCDFVREKTCVACRRAPGVPHHVHARGMGGAVADWLTVWTSEFVLVDLLGNVVPLCQACHDVLHVSGLSKLEAKVGTKLDLSLQAEAWGEVFKKKRPQEFAVIVRGFAA